MEFLSGAISIKLKNDDKKISDLSAFQLLMQRMLGLCFDGRTEIDVSGNAKVSPSDNVDESFFELSNLHSIDNYGCFQDSNGISILKMNLNEN